jgi:deoxyribodipyrimidine photo-lyase
MTDAPVLVLFRRDLRVADNPAVAAAVATGSPVAFAYVLDESCRFSPGAAQKWYLAGSLENLSAALSRLGGSLVLRRGPQNRCVLELAAELGAGAVFWNRRYAPEEIAVDAALKKDLGEKGVEVRTFNASLLREPWETTTKAGEPFKVFTPFWRALQQLGPSRDLSPAPKRFAPAQMFASDDLDQWRLRPEKPNWAREFGEHWTPGEKAAHKALDAFLETRIDTYPTERDQPSVRGTSALSPRLALGELSPLQIWRATMNAIDNGAVNASAGQKFLSEIAWREFSYSLLYNYPTIVDRAWRPAFDAMPWRDDDASFLAWTRGQTGVPLVDAGMRELWRTGWMHNRVRMVVASFLTKNLLIDWRRGERWFWDTLVDADPASNIASWQWVAGSGADAAPYFRIFNPVSQSEKFDPDGVYLRRYVREIAELDVKSIHAPWLAAPGFLHGAPNARGENYPRPIVDLSSSRVRALQAYQELKS